MPDQGGQPRSGFLRNTKVLAVGSLITMLFSVGR